jgi:hypothetical protein
MNTRLLRTLLITGLLVSARFAAAQSAEPTFDDLDKNHDGVLSKDEVAALFPSTSDSGSRGQHGAGSGSGTGGGRGGFGGGHGGFGGGFGGGGGGLGGGFGGGRGGQGAGAPQGTGASHSAKPPNIDQIFKSWDKDGNGTISREEFDARPRGNTGNRRHGASSSDDRAPPSL